MQDVVHCSPVDWSLVVRRVLFQRDFKAHQPRTPKRNSRKVCSKSGRYVMPVMLSSFGQSLKQSWTPKYTCQHYDYKVWPILQSFCYPNVEPWPFHAISIHFSTIGLTGQRGQAHLDQFGGRREDLCASWVCQVFSGVKVQQQKTIKQNQTRQDRTQQANIMQLRKKIGVRRNLV